MKTVTVAAGEGTRMRPLTESRLKSLLPVGGRSLFERILDVCTPPVDGSVIVDADGDKTDIETRLNTGVTLGVDATTDAGEQVMRDGGGNL